MNYINCSEEKIKTWLRENLSEERYLHSLGTAECAKSLALKFNESPEKAYCAGLLHDAAKCFPHEKLLKIVDEHFNLDDEERNNKKTLHSPASAYIAQSVFGVKDKEILSAIRWHTLGKPDMTTFEKIIFLADKIETNTREDSYRKDIADLVDKDSDLDRALLLCYKKTIVSLVNRDLRICPMTIEIYNKLQSKISS